MESHSPNPIAPTTDDAESKMRRNLGIDGASPSSSSNDPMKAARQAIRSQVTAREYTERQLVQAQGAIQDLRTRLRQVHHERETVVAAAQSAMAAKEAAERSMRAAEGALTTERANRVRTEGMLRDAEATIRDLREKLATANQTLHTTQADLTAERQARSSVDDGVMAAQGVVTRIAEEVVPAVRRPVGRPRKATVVQTVQTVITPPEMAVATRDDAVPPNVNAAGQAVRRPVGRPRKMVVVEPTSTLMTPPRKVQVVGRVVTGRDDKPNQKVINRSADNEEPVQWWVEGWKGR
jgi:hypothetical protein